MKDHINYCKDCKKNTLHTSKLDFLGHIKKFTTTCTACGKKSVEIEGKCIIQQLKGCPIMAKKDCNNCLFKVKDKEDLINRYRGMAKNLAEPASIKLMDELQGILKDLEYLEELEDSHD